MPSTICIVENDPHDALIAADVGRSIGFDSVWTFDCTSKAMGYLEKGLEGRVSLPDLIVVDLDLGQESGYDLLRLWRVSPKLAKIPLLVWSVLGERHQGFCDLFKATAYIPKWKGPEMLREALLNCLADHESATSGS